MSNLKGFGIQCRKGFVSENVESNGVSLEIIAAGLDYNMS